MDQTTTTPGHRQIVWSPKRAVAVTLIVVGITGLILLVAQFRHILILLLLAIVLATALKPAVAWLNRQGVRWTLAVSVVFALMFLAVLAVGILAGPKIVREGSDFVAEMPERYQGFRNWLQEQHSVGKLASQAFPEDLPNLLTPTDKTSAESDASEKNGSALSTASRLVMQSMLATIMVCILSAYWLLQEQRTVQALIVAVPSQRREETKTFLEAIDQKVGAYVRGQFLLCLIVGTLTLIGYWAIGLPNALLLAAIAGVLEAIPMLGPILGAIPALIMAAAIDPSKLLGVVVVTIVIQQVENYLLVPRIMDRAVGIHGFVTLLAMVGFAALFGILGAILAIPLAAIVQLIVERYVLSDDLLEPPEPQGRDRISRLRFELQSLIKDIRLIVRNKPAGEEGDSDSLEEAIESLALDLDQNLKQESEAETERASSSAAGEADAGAEGAAGERDGGGEEGGEEDVPRRRRQILNTPTSIG